MCSERKHYGNTERVDWVREERGVRRSRGESVRVERVGDRLLLDIVELEVELEREVHDAVAVRREHAMLEPELAEVGPRVVELEVEQAPLHEQYCRRAARVRSPVLNAQLARRFWG